jgi:hypothetical protein
MPLMSVVATDRAAISLGKNRGRCLRQQWVQPAEYSARLRDLHISVEPPRAADLVREDGSCSDSEARFFAFMSSLLAAVPADTGIRDLGKTIAVRLVPAGEPLRLESYFSARLSDAGPRPPTLSFATPYDRAAELGKIVTTQAWPHLRSMNALEEQFKTMTGFQYHVIEENPDYRVIFSALETAARTVNEKIGAIAPERLAGLSRLGPYPAGLALRSGEFGLWEGKMHPLDVADQTFLAILDEIQPYQ